jgi:hypothetical protein
MKAIGVVKLSCFQAIQMTCLWEILKLHYHKFHVVWHKSFSLFALLVNWPPLAMQWCHSFVKIHLCLPKLVFNVACRLSTWCFAMWAWRWWLIKYARDFTIKSFSLGSWELAFRFEQTSPIVEKYLVFFLCFSIDSIDCRSMVVREGSTYELQPWGVSILQPSMNFLILISDLYFINEFTCGSSYCVFVHCFFVSKWICVWVRVHIFASNLNVLMGLYIYVESKHLRCWVWTFARGNVWQVCLWFYVNWHASSLNIYVESKYLLGVSVCKVSVQLCVNWCVSSLSIYVEFEHLLGVGGCQIYMQLYVDQCALSLFMWTYLCQICLCQFVWVN